MNYFKKSQNQNKNQKVSLPHICFEILGRNLCVGEKVSNWENKSLRLSQLHFAFTEVWILTQIAKKCRNLKEYATTAKAIPEKSELEVKYQ